MKLWQRILKFRHRHQDFDDEVSAHLAMAAADRKARGESPAEAERNARREFGNALLIREVTHDINGWTAVENVIRNLRYAGRQLRRTPVFSGVAVATLALGLGATTAMFTIVDGVLLRPLAFSQPERLYLARTVPPPAAGIGGDFPVNARQFAEWREHCGGCESLALFQYQDMTLAGSGEPLKLPSLWVTPEFFRTLGVEPAIGRGFPPEAGNGGAVILSHQLWRSRFNSDPAVPGRTVRLNGESYEVVGVMPESLHLPKGDEWGAYSGPDAAPLIFRPLTINVKSARPVGNLNYGALIRLKPGVSAAQAEAELNALLAEFRRQFRMETRIRVVPLDQQVTRGARSSLWMLLASVAAVLLIGCVNVGNLMLARTAGRHREAAIRMALGSTREQLFGLLLGEALVLVVLGGALGVGLAWVGVQLFEAAAPVGIARIDEVHLDWRALLFAAGAMAVSTVMCGLVPAWRLSRTSVQEALKSGGAGATDSRARLELRGVLVGVEVALSTVLLICGALLLLSFWRVMKVEKGFDVARIVTQDVSYLSPRYSHGARRQEVLNTVDRLSAIPGVQVAAAVSRLPLRGDEFVSELEDPAQPPRKVDESALGNFRFVTPGYWTAMGIPLRMGRYLDASDQDQPRAVISERAARFLWPGQNPLGRHVRGVGDKAPVLEVVGVVGEVRSRPRERAAHDGVRALLAHATGGHVVCAEDVWGGGFGDAAVARSAGARRSGNGAPAAGGNGADC